MKFRILALLTSLFSVSASAELITSWATTLGIVNNEYDSGSNITVVYALEHKGFLLNLNPIDVNMFSVQPEGYRTERLSNGNEVCRNENNGQFADESNCQGLEMDFAASFEAGYIFNNLTYPLSVSIGSRLGGDKEIGGNSDPYVMLQLFHDTTRFYGSMKSNSDSLVVSGGYWF